jgi:hypothetical protein
MNNYQPDRWVLVKLEAYKETIYKILASWYGGYLGSDYWRLSSGLVSRIDVDGRYVLRNESGSTYRCSKGNYGMSGYTTEVFESYEKQNDDKISISLLSEEEAKKYIESLPRTQASSG